MHNCQIIDQLQIPQVLLHPFKPAFFMRHVLMSAFLMHCVLIHSMAFAWLKSVFLFAKNTRLYENRYRFFFTQCDSRLFVVLSRTQFVCLIRFKNETPLQGLMWKGTFLIISRSSLFTDWSQAGFNILMKLKRTKTTLKKQHETKPNQLALTKILVRTSNIFTKW